MTMLRLGFVALVDARRGRLRVGAPDRASNIQNLNGISDDISAVTMTQSDSQKVADPNLPTTYPRSYQLPQD